MEDSTTSTEPVCSLCKATSSLMWFRNQDSEILCLDCHSPDKNGAQGQSDSRHNTPPESSQQPPPQNNSSPLLPSRRITRQSKHDKEKQQVKQQKPKVNPQVQPNSIIINDTPGPSSSSSSTHSICTKASSTSSKGRHSLWKQQLVPVKAPLYQGSITTSDSVIHKGITYEVGDVVSLLDRDGGVYYAVIRGFLQDEYSEKFAALTWLLPMYPNPTHFDPSTFVLGPEEDCPRLMDYIEFVCHSPKSRHFQASYFHDIEQAELWKKTSLS